MSAVTKTDASDSELRIERKPLRVEIDFVIDRADALAGRVLSELPTHAGLSRVATGVSQIAREAKQVSQRLRRPIGWHRLPAAGLIVLVALFCGLLYWQFLHTSTLKIAVPQEDAVQLRSTVKSRLGLKRVVTRGERENLELLQAGEVDLAYVQGGVDIPAGFPRTELEQSELVLLFLRDSISHPTQMRKVLTSQVDQGSHSLAKIFARYWRISDRVEYVHEWQQLTEDADYRIAQAIDAVFVVKDPLSRRLEGTAARLADAGFRLVPPDIGAMSLRLEYLRPFDVLPGYLDPVAQLPRQPVATYAVVTYLVARPQLRAQQLADVHRLLQVDRGLPDPRAEPSVNLASEVVQGLEAALSITVYVGLAFLAVLGVDVLAYRRRFQELNSLVSLISMQQSSKDVMTGTPAERLHNVIYLSCCSDLLGLIATITGYYTQENSSLLYHRLSDIIHERCDGLKINIQLKILQVLIDLPPQSLAGGPPLDPSMPETPAGSPPSATASKS